MPELPFSGGIGCWPPRLLGQLLVACSGRRLIATGRSAHAAIMMRRDWSGEIFLQNHLINMYAKWGEMENARKVFDGVHVKNVVTWTALISGYARCGMGERAVGVFAEMVGEDAGVRPNEYTYASVISGCGEQGLLKYGMQAHCHCLRRGFLSHTMVSNVVVTLYVAHGLVSDARMAFEEIGNPDEISWNSLISGYAQNGHFENAVQTFWKMKKAGIHVTSVSLSSAVSSCLVDKVCGRLLHGHALKLGLESDCFTACALLKMYSRWKETVDGWKVFEALEYKDLASWNALIEGCSESGMNEMGLHVFCDLVEFGPCIDDITIITVLGICSTLVMLVFGRLVHCLSVKTGLERKVKVENSLVNLYAKCGSLDDSIKVFSHLKDRNVISWTAMIGALALHGKVNEAMELLEEMNRDGTMPNRTTYACLLWACRHTGSIDHGKRIFKSMSIEADEEHYNCMVRLLAEGGKFDEAEQFIRNSPKKYEETLWQALLVCCKNSNEFNKGLTIAEKILRAGLHFQPPMLVLMSQIFAAAGRWDQAEELRKDMKEMGLKKEPGCSWVDLDNEFKGLTSSVTKKGDFSIGDFAAVYQYNDTTIEAKVDAKSNISTTFTFLDVFPSTKCITNLKFPDYKTGKVEFQYKHHHGALTTAVGLSQSPVLDLSPTLGSPGVAVGFEAGYDSLSNTLTKYNAGIGVTKPEASFAIFLAEKRDLLKASYHHLVHPENNTIAVAGASRKLSTKENAFSIGAAHNIDPLTIVKAKVDNLGKVSALLQHELKPKSVFTILGEFDTKALEKSPKFGLALALKP